MKELNLPKCATVVNIEAVSAFFFSIETSSTGRCNIY